MIQRVNEACSYFPCHENLEDCTFCYCPFYPCQEEALGKYMYSSKSNKKVWSCQDCDWIHQRKTVDRLHRLIRGHGSELRRDIPRVKNKILPDTRTGVLVLGHGSRFPKADLIMLDIVKTLKQRLHSRLILSASMQFSQPDLSAGIKILAERNCKLIIIVPLFLFGGNHVMRDIPQMLKEENVKYPEITFSYARNLGADTRITDIVMERIEEAINEVSNQAATKNTGKKF